MSQQGAVRVVRDPMIQFGPFRVLQRVDGPFIVIDERRPLGDRTVARHKDAKSAEADAKARSARA